jgi:flagellar basal body-associated protein FliL
VDDTEKKHKLKELERTLAQELDPPLQTPTSKIPPLDVALPPPAASPTATGSSPNSGTGSVTVAGTAPVSSGTVTATPPVGGGDAAAQIPTISIDEFDALLRKNDPEFDKQMKEMGEGIKSDVAGLSLEKLNIDDLIKDEEEENAPLPKQADEPPPPLVPRSRFFAKIANTVSALLSFPWSVLKAVRGRGLKASLEALKTSAPAVAAKIKSEVGEIFLEAKIGFQNFKKATKDSKATIFGLLVTAVLFLYFLKLLVTGRGLSFPETPEYMSSFEPVASRIVTFEESAEMEDFNSPLRHPEHVVLLRKIVVNLKRSAKSTQKPMAIFELFIEAGSKDAAIELKDREKEMLDLTARVAESVAFDDFETESGKKKFKAAVRRELNKALTTGRVRQIYFKTVFHKR